MRFPGFDEPWAIYSAEELFQNITDKNHADETVLTIVQGKGTLPREQAGRNIHYNNASLSNYKMVQKGDFIIHLRSFEGGLEIANENGIVSPAYTILRAKRPHSSRFYEAYFHTNEFINHVLSKSVEGIRDGRQISYDAFKWLGIPYCNPNEQEKIAELFSTLSRRIEKQSALVDSLKKYKRGLVFAMFCSNNPYGIVVEATPLTRLLKEYRNRETTNLRVCSVAVTKGVVDQIEHLGRRFSAADTSHYGRVKHGDVVYTKSPTGDFPYGIVKQNWLHEDVAVSPLYGVYTPLSFETGYLIHTYFEQSNNTNNHLRTLAQKGAKNTINITTAHFLDKDIPFPVSQDDIKFLVGLFTKINDRIKNEECKLSLFVQQRRTLMQQLFI